LFTVCCSSLNVVVVVVVVAAAGSRPAGALGGNWTEAGTRRSFSKDTGTLGGERERDFF